ncbi:unnamed protein product [Oikopleura dioica]|uniref:Uncharacterized protein n=1 Tax=Oikopleura dioica TaxID=34765 RepID=E4Y5D7_OIKDI|nr:unnamed protein product [Oikopleura dioica]
MKVPKSIRFLTKRGKDKEEKELRKWSSNPDLKNEIIQDGAAKRRKTRGHQSLEIYHLQVPWQV